MEYCSLSRTLIVFDEAEAPPHYHHSSYCILLSFLIYSFFVLSLPALSPLQPPTHNSIAPPLSSLYFSPTTLYWLCFPLTNLTLFSLLRVTNPCIFPSACLRDLRIPSPSPSPCPALFCPQLIPRNQSRRGLGPFYHSSGRTHRVLTLAH